MAEGWQLDFTSTDTLSGCGPWISPGGQLVDRADGDAAPNAALQRAPLMRRLRFLTPSGAHEDVNPMPRNRHIFASMPKPAETRERATRFVQASREFSPASSAFHWQRACNSVSERSAGRLRGTGGARHWSKGRSIFLSLRSILIVLITSIVCAPSAKGDGRETGSRVARST